MVGKYLRNLVMNLKVNTMIKLAFSMALNLGIMATMVYLRSGALPELDLKPAPVLGPKDWALMVSTALFLWLVPVVAGLSFFMF